jgi:glycosyltransferase involved in cell wall biosynthesis
MHIGLVCGSIPSVRCGVADYTRLLASALESAGMRNTVFGGTRWSLAGLNRLLDDAAVRACDALHIQYPAMGFGWSLAPHAIGYLARLPTIVTLHEFTLVASLRKISMMAFAGGVRHLVFTTDHEQASFVRTMKWVNQRTSVIPIGSNVPFLPSRPPANPVVACFGQIKPNRGWESFIMLAQRARTSGRNYRFRVIGSPLPGQQQYLAKLRARCTDLPIDWRIDLDAHGVAAALSTATLAYLPYPDGVSARRGSLLAAMGNGLPVVTTLGPACSAELNQLVEAAASPSAALERIDALMHDAQLMRRRRRASTTFAARFAWASIAQQHGAIYECAIRGAGRRPGHQARNWNVSCR